MVNTGHVRGSEDPNVLLARVERYLPSNYSASVGEGRVIIEGEDVAGWTWDSYIVPRLASGLIFVDKVGE